MDNINSKIEAILKENLDSFELEKKLQSVFGILPEEYRTMVTKLRDNENLANLIAEAIFKKNNPAVEEQPSLADSMYPKMKEYLEESRKPFEYDENKTIGEMLYPNSPICH